VDSGLVHAEPTSSPILQRLGFSAYVVDQVNQLNTTIRVLDAAVQSGNVEAAKTAYAKARPFYERAESSVEGFAIPGFAVDDNAVRNLARLGRSIVAPSWAVLGFGRASAGPGQQTPRNLLGFKDGTRNIATSDEYLRYVWI
jgi:hypothetical protein